MKKAAFLLLVSVCISGFCLTGCGQTGPLYLPKADTPAARITPAIAPAAATSSSASITQ